MANTYTQLTSDTDQWDAPPFVTASITPTANKLVILTVWAFAQAGSTPFYSPSSVTGNGLTWVEIGHQDYFPDDVGAPTVNLHCRVSMYRAMGASPTAGSITINYSGTLPDGISWSVTEFDGTDVSGTNGSGAIVQVVGAQSMAIPAPNLTVNMAALTSASNTTLAAFGGPWDNAAGAAITLSPGTGYTSLATGGGNWLYWLSEVKLAGDNTPSVTSTGAAEALGGMAIEIKALTVDTHVSLTGVSATGSIGTLAVKSQKAIAGLFGSTELGSVTLPVVHGVSATGSVGTLSPRIAANVQLTGVAATGAVGNLTSTLEKVLTSIEVPAVLGDITIHKDSQLQISAVEAATNVGVLSVRILHDILEPPPPPPRVNNNFAAKPKKRLAQPDHGLNWVLRTIGGADNPLNGMVREIYPEIDEDVLSHTVTNIMTEMNNFIAMKRGILTKALIDAKEAQLVKFYALKAIQEHNADIVLDEDTVYKPGLLS